MAATCKKSNTSIRCRQTSAEPFFLISEEDEARVGHAPRDVEELQQVVELTVDVPHDRERTLEMNNIRFVHERLLERLAELLERRRREDLAPQKALNRLVERHRRRHFRPRFSPPSFAKGGK
jgi:hypothetical protein